MKKTKKGFTLIEMLVVVLIIGILAAIAVPQYQKAVAKAELAQIISMVRSIKEAEEVYYLAHNQYTTLDNLDVSINNPDITCDIGGQEYFGCGNKNFIIYYYFKNSKLPGYTHCMANTTDENSAKAYACQEFIKAQSYEIHGTWEKNGWLYFDGTANF